MSVRLQRMVDLDFSTVTAIDLFVYCLTQEPRGHFVLDKMGQSAKERWGLIQSPTGVDDCYTGGAASAEVPANSIGSVLAAWIDAHAMSQSSIALDISCMSRPTMAAVFQAVFEASQRKSIRLTVVYVLADYTAPPKELPPNEDIRPISDWFAGWPSDATASTSLIVGLGYEHDKAVGACEFFDAGDTWVFNPKSPIDEYDQEVKLNNQELLARASRRDRVIPYRVDRPTEAFGQLASAVSRILPKMNPVLLPFGPKIFYVLNLLVAAVYKEVGVWHVTGDSYIADVLHTPSAFIPAFQIDLVPRSSRPE